MGIKRYVKRGTRVGAIALLAFSLTTPGSFASGSNLQSTMSNRFEGNLNQWDNVPHAAVSSSQHLEELKAVVQNGKLYAMVKGPGLEAKGTWYVDLDANETTGLSIPYWENSTGIDVKIEDGQVWTVLEGNWVKTGSAAEGYEGSIYEVEVDLSQFPDYQTSNLRIAFAQPGKQYLPSPGGLMLIVPPPSGAAFGPDVNISVDGDVNDWQGVEPGAKSADGQTTLYAAEDESNLYVLVQGRMAEFNDIFIDTDRSADTGYTDAGWPEFGGDWLIENGGLFKSTGAGWNWGPAAGASIEYAENGTGNERVIEYKVPLSDLDLSKARPITLGLASNDIRVPAAGEHTPLVAPPMPKIVVDGNGDEWEALPVVATGEGKVTSLKAFARNGKISVLAQAQTFDQETNLFIDSDRNPETGYVGWEYKRTGADYLVQNGTLYKSTGAGWSWDEIGPVPWVVKDASEQGQKLLETEIDLSSYANGGETMSVALGVGGDYAPAKNSEGEYALAAGPSGGSITVDGKDDDWASIDQVIKGKGETITLKAAQDKKKVYLLAEGKNINTQNEFYLDTDANAETGMQSAQWTNFGPDAMIQYNHLYLFNQQKNDWEDQGPVHAEITSDYAKFYFYQDQIGRQSPEPITLGYVGKHAYHLPASGEAPLVLNQNIQTQKSIGFEPKENFEVLNNPFKGWVGWANTKQPLVQPHSLVYANISWRELEPEKGKFNWEEIESKFQFEKWQQEGTRINLRFVLDDPGNGPEKDIPDWLYDELVKAEGQEGAGKWYDTPSSVVGKGFAPNYSSPTLIAEHERAIQALADRYNNHPGIAFIQIGSLGHWGEFHNWPEEVSGKFPSLSVSDQYVSHYLERFTNKMVGMRKPFPIAADNKLGLFNDVFGSKGATDTWVDWTVNGWNEIGSYVDNGQDPQEAQAASKMPDFWKYAYSGGEFHSGNTRLSVGDSTIMESLREARVSHTSWLGPSSPASYVKGKDITESEQANIDLLHNTMGYRFVLESVQHDHKGEIGDGLKLSFLWNNKGVAPFYFDWPLAVALQDNKGNIVTESIQRLDSIDIREWLPGRHEVNVDYSLSKNLKPGRYQLVIAILDPATGKPGIKLGIEGERPDGWTQLDAVTVSR
jgi:Domain of unknown function (DUF4832)/Beta-galactosidase